MKEKNLDRRQNRSNKDWKGQLKVLFSVLLLCFMLAGIQACGSSGVPESEKESSVNVSDITVDRMSQGTEDTASSGTSEAESTVVNSQEESREAASKSEAESIAASKSEAESIAASKSEAESIAASKSEAESIAAREASEAASRAEAEAAARTMPAQVTYVGNANPRSRKFHHFWCSSVDQMAEHNKVFFYGGREEPISQGYVPCKKCNP